MVKGTKGTSKGKTKAAPAVQPSQPTGETAPSLSATELTALHHTYDAKTDDVTLSVSEIEATSESLSTDEHYEGVGFDLADFDALVGMGYMSLSAGIYTITPTGEKRSEAEREADKATPTPAPEKTTAQRYAESMEFAETVESLPPRDKQAMYTAVRWAEQLDINLLNLEKPVGELAFDERVMLAAYRSRDYHVFSHSSGDLLKDERRADELARAKKYKPLETQTDISERDHETWYTTLEMVAMDLTHFMAKAWIPRGVMFYENNYSQMVFDLSNTMLESLAENSLFHELDALILWLKYRDEIEGDQGESEGGEDD
jgi:hypothetical protein